MAKHNILGKRGEDLAAEYLEQHGYTIHDRDWHCGHKDLDLVVTKDDTIVFVEVKTRHSTTLSQPFEAVDRRKQDKIIQTAIIYLYEKKLECDCRFDVCEVFVNQETLRLHKIHYIENAFIMEDSHGYF